MVEKVNFVYVPEDRFSADNGLAKAMKQIGRERISAVVGDEFRDYRVTRDAVEDYDVSFVFLDEGLDKTERYAHEHSIHDRETVQVVSPDSVGAAERLIDALRGLDIEIMQVGAPAPEEPSL